jgi:steroid delta-isomerase-like uncharacterized protein
MTSAIIESYYRAFNARDYPAMLELLSEDVAHDVNQGAREFGRDRFTTFLARMDVCYREQVVDLVVLSDASGERCAAEFTVLGKYLKADGPLPDARGQMYRLPAGAFFALRGGKIARVTTYYNLSDWLAQVTGEQP